MANHRIIVKSKPGVGNQLKKENFHLESCAYPDPKKLEENEVIVKTLYLTIDSKIRMDFNDETGSSYFPPLKIGDLIWGVSGIGIVEYSKDPNFKPGDIVQKNHYPWQEIAHFKTEGVKKVDKEITGERITLYLSCYGVPGLTTLNAIREQGFINIEKNETFVVSAAAGAYGTLAGQMAKLDGFVGKTVGICGSERKCKFLIEEKVYDDAVNYKTANFEIRLKETCPNGIDIYFDNVGGSISDSVINLMNENGRIILCGQNMTYINEGDYLKPLGEHITGILKQKKIKREMFCNLHHTEKYPANLQQISLWLKENKIKVFETIEESFENVTKAYFKLVNGENIGRQLVRCSTQF